MPGFRTGFGAAHFRMIASEKTGYSSITLGLVGLSQVTFPPDFKYGVYNDRNDIAAEAENIIVFFDFRKNTKLAIPDELRERIEKLEKIKDGFALVTSPGRLAASPSPTRRRQVPSLAAESAEHMVKENRISGICVAWASAGLRWGEVLQSLQLHRRGR